MTPEQVLDFWFAGDPATFRKEWFEKSDAFDASCVQFADALRDAKNGAFDHWADTPGGALALIILLDQFPRNLHRDSPEAFAADTKARQVAQSVIARKFDETLGPLERLFVYMPFEHSENPADQDLSVRLFTPLGEEMARHAIGHRDVIRRFGRFPRRNAALGRASTPEELDYLARPDCGYSAA
jgi:uncharacterized protein (DUF924 family)